MTRLAAAATLLLAAFAPPASADLLRDRCAWLGAPSHPAHDDVRMTPVVVDLDGDGVSEIVVVAADASGTGNGVLVGIDGRDCSTIFVTASPGCRQCVGDSACRDLDENGDGAVLVRGGLAAGDLDGDGRPELVGVLEAETGIAPQRIVAYAADGSFLWCSARVPPPPGSFNGSLFRGIPAIADLDADGSPEIVVGATIFDSQGNLRSTRSDGEYLDAPAVPVDVDGNGTQEVVVGSALLSSSGSELWQRADRWSISRTASAVADLDGDGDPEAIVPNEPRREIAVLDARTGVTVSTLALPADAPTCVTSIGTPAAADVDGDGIAEIAVATSSWVCLLDSGPPMTTRWCEPVVDCTGGWVVPVFADVTGDGLPEILLRDQHELVVLAADGSVLQRMPSSSATIQESVVAVDLEGDCEGEILVPADDGVTGMQRGVRVLVGDDAPLPPYRGVWNQNAYSIANVADDATIPPAPPVPASFHAQALRAPGSGAAVAADRTVLWPPNHRMVRVAITSDDGSPVTVTSVRQDEPVEDRGDGRFEPDAEIRGGELFLRAERDGRSDGRTYHVEVVTGGGGGSCSSVASLTICVPHDVRRGRRGTLAADCIDQGPSFDSTAP